MEVYTYSEARQNMAALLEKADQGECIRIRRKDGRLFELRAAKENFPPGLLLRLFYFYSASRRLDHETGAKQSAFR